MYIVMECIQEGEDLNEIMEKRAVVQNEANGTNVHYGTFPEQEVARLVYMIASGIYHIHKNGIIHRDIKPDNCLLTADNGLKIIDFGLAKHASKREYGQSYIGSMLYMAPEVFELSGNNEAYSAPVDVWALGITMY